LAIYWLHGRQNRCDFSPESAHEKTPQVFAGLLVTSKRRAWDSNPQPLAGHLNSNQANNAEIPDDIARLADCAARGAAINANSDSTLELVTSRWHQLPEAIRAAIVALVELH
jgi:hypothetical protein